MTQTPAESEVDFGRMLVEQRLVPPAHVEECMAEIRRLAAEGVTPLPRLGELLVRRGYLASSSIDTIAHPAGAAGAMSGGDGQPPPEVLAAPAGSRMGKYVRTRKLGSGGMGEVWQAWDMDLGRWVAVKFLKGDDEAEIARFKREAKMAARLAHPNIAAVYEVGDDRGRPYIVMQCIDGETLKKFPRRDTRTLVQLLREAVMAVAYAHQHGIVHRDLKPTNIIVTRAKVAGAGSREQTDYHVYVMDFGLAKKTTGGSTISVTGVAIGTPQYMSPEQARGRVHDVDERSDIYSLGASLYELIIGCPPFSGEALDVLKQVATVDPVALRKVKPEIDVDLETIVMKCMEKDPARRYQTALELAGDLQRWLDEEPIQGRRPGMAYLLKRRMESHRIAIAAAAGAVLVTVALAAVLVAVKTRRAEDAGRVQEERAVLARHEAMEQLGRATELALRAALALRREGNLAGMRQFGEETESACRESIWRFPGQAEPHYRLGRMYRALMRFDDALREQEAALAKDSGLAAARYERGILCLRRYEARLEALTQEWLRHQAREVGGQPGKSRSEPPPAEELEDAEARGWKSKALEDLAASELPSARAMAAWLNNGKDVERLFEEACRVGPDEAEAWEWLGRLAERQASYPKAVTCFTRGLEQDRGYIPLLERRAWIHFMMAGRLAVQGGDPTQCFRSAFDDYDALVRIDPANLAARLHRGEARFNLGSHLETRGNDPSVFYTQAIEDYEAVLKAKPESEEPWVRRGNAKVRLGTYRAARGQDPTILYQEAEGDFKRALEIASDSSETWVRRGNLRINWGAYESDGGVDPSPRYQAAMEDFARAIALDASHEEPWLRRATAATNLAVYRARRGEDPAKLYEAAIADYNESIRLNPAWFEPLMGRAQARSTWGMHLMTRREDPTALFKAAAGDFDAATRMNPSHAEAWLLWGALHTRWATLQSLKKADPVGEFTQAIRKLDRALQLNPSDPHALSLRANVHFGIAEYEGREQRDATASYRAALRDAEELARIHPDMAPKVRSIAETCRERLGPPPQE